MIIINKNNYKGNNLQINKNQIFIDGELVELKEDEKSINITVNGNIEMLNVDYCNELKIIGDCKDITSKNGNIQVEGNVNRNITSKNGNIICRNVGGDIETKNGNIIHS